MTVQILLKLRLLLYVCASIYLMPNPVYATKVVYSIPSILVDHPFWQSTLPIAKASAKQLNLELVIEYSGADRFSYLEQIKKTVERHQPDYLILRVISGNALAIFEYLEQQQVHFITFESPYTEQELTQLGKPGDKFKFWLNQILYDNTDASQVLLNKALQTNNNRVLALGGSWGSVSLDREKALNQLCQTQHKCKLLQVAKTHWDSSVVHSLLSQLDKRHSTPDILWTVGSEVALASVEYYAKHNPAPKIITFDWSVDVFNAMINHKISASMGGHFIFPAIALLNIYDIQQGVPVQNWRNQQHLLQLDYVNAVNVLWVQQKMANIDWLQFDFTQFSLKNAPAPKTFSALEWLSKQ